jgi:hypothetical protein
MSFSLKLIYKYYTIKKDMLNELINISLKEQDFL